MAADQTGQKKSYSVEDESIENVQINEVRGKTSVENAKEVQKDIWTQLNGLCNWTFREWHKGNF